MRILIVGAGIVGFNLAQELSKEGHDIAIIDQNPEKMRRISDTLDVLSIIGNACLPTVLVKAGIKNMEMVIAVTEKDEINLLVCFLASKFNVSKRFARIRNEEFTEENRIFSPEELYIDHVINPGDIIIDTIHKIISTPGVVNVAEFAEGEILLREFDIPADAPLAGKEIRELSGVSAMDSFVIVAIVRQGKLVIPKAEDVIQPGDKIYTIIDKEFLPFLLPMLNKSVEEVAKVVIYGANPFSINLAKSLEEKIRDLCLIEPSRKKANQAAEILSRCVVHHGSGTDMHLFNDINMKDADFFLSLSEDDESNILSALLAKKHGAKRVLVITNDPEYLPILDSIGMDITINPRLITVSAILKHLRKGRVMSVFKLIEDAEVMEIGVDANSAIVNKKIAKVKFPENAMIGALLRKGEMMVPTDEIEIQAGDSVIVVALPEAIVKIEKLFGSKRNFLPFR
ncbi:MAG: Trk system potassium transporter TrkA [Nitrospinae bacterium]|jgi:trk system potassium uptake protein|nr:Trk system potassium transporter TrkA [Nitrospinota bacterium]MDA1110283.1 Trk system potassium transporter TrkA [Nitrospinota bacterium]